MLLAMTADMERTRKKQQLCTPGKDETKESLSLSPACTTKISNKRAIVSGDRFSNAVENKAEIYEDMFACVGVEQSHSGSPGKNRRSTSSSKPISDENGAPTCEESP